MTYRYHAYGLEVVSATAIEALRSVPSRSETFDLQFEAGREPGWARDLRALPAKTLTRRQEPEGSVEPSFVLTQYGDERGYELCYSDGARFVTDGAATRVWGTHQPPMTSEEMAFYFLGPVMGFLLRRRRITSLHSSCVEYRGRAICLCGEAGFGKSTTAAALALRGLPVIAEDIVPLQETPEGFRAVSGYPRVCLWPESVQMLLGSAEALPLITTGWEKRYLALDGERAKFASGALPLALVYAFAPRSGDAQAPRIEKLGAREALLELVRNTYMNWALGREQRALEFDTLSRLVQCVPVRRLIPHEEPEKLAALCDLILQDAQGFLSNPQSVPQAIRG